MKSSRQFSERRRIAVIGAGAAGLGAAWALSRVHDVVLYEAQTEIGGHAHTVDVAQDGGGNIAVDTGFIVYNEVNYPNLVRLFATLDVPTHPAPMGFSVSMNGGQLEYSGQGIRGLFAQPENLVRGRFLGMVRDILRFYRHAPTLLDDPKAGGQTLGAYLQSHRYGKAFIEDHLLPMAAAIWSSPMRTMLEFPVVSFVRFCENHGLLRLRDRPQWRTVTGGSRTYVRRLIADMPQVEVRAATPVSKVIRTGNSVEVVTAGGHRDVFDEVVMAAHAGQSLGMVEVPTELEHAILGRFHTQENKTVLHKDAHLMPRRHAVWSSWNYLGREGDAGRHLCVTYWMNMLQSLDRDFPLFVTLNPFIAPESEKVLLNLTYYHPVFDAHALAAQGQLPSIQGQDRLWFCGAWSGYGFHEDAFSSGIEIAEAMGCPAPWRSNQGRSSPGG